MRGLVQMGVAAALAGLSGCSGSRSACAGLTDGAVVDRIVRDYAAEPATSKGDPAQMQLSRARVAGIGRRSAPGALTQVWFSQDDHTVTVATLGADCALAFRPGLTPDAIRDAAVPTKRAAF
jgi:hypothetical protein